MADEQKPEEPKPEDKPTLPSGSANPPGWYQWLLKILPRNVVAIIGTSVLAVLATGVNCVLQKNGLDPIPVPEVPTPIWPDGVVYPEELERQQGLVTLKKLQGFAEFSETDANNLIFNADEDIPLWRMYNTANGVGLPSRSQGPIGTCVAFGYAGCIELRIAVQVVTKPNGVRTEPIADIAQEVIYGGSRVDVNGGRCPIPKGPDGRNDGSCGIWAVQSLSKIGVCKRQRIGSYDLTNYNIDTARQWGDNGVPEEVKKICSSNLCTYALVKTPEELLKSLQTGCPVAVCSGVGFGDYSKVITRGEEGLLRPVNTWNHCMYFAGYRADKRWFLIVNSWGDTWVNGPKGKFEDIPNGSFWVEWDVAKRMLENRGYEGPRPDSFAISGVNGFQRKKLRPQDWVKQPNNLKPLVGAFHDFAISF